jgi:hypothetical protein
MDNVKSDVMLALWDAFKREGIRVPYPVREIRVRGGALPVESGGGGFRLDGWMQVFLDPRHLNPRLPQAAPITKLDPYINHSRSRRSMTRP